MWKIACIVLSGLLAFAAGAQMTGGFSTIDVNDAGAQSALKAAVVEYNNRLNDLYVYQPSKVIKVERQVVSGFVYKITVEMERTNCKKGGANEVCEVHNDPTVARSYQCTFKVWVQPWTNFTKVLEPRC